MLRRLPLGFAGVVAAAIAIAACSSSNATQTISVGPNFPSQTLYAANVSENAVNIYATGSPVPASTKGPLYQISCSSCTTFAGPQYLTFDSLSDLWVTSWFASTSSGGITEFKALATGNVVAFQSFSLSNVRPRGIADYTPTFSGTTTPVDVLVVAVTDPSQPAAFNSGLQFYLGSVLTAPYSTLAGPATGLNVPSGVAVDSHNNIYAANLQGASVTEYSIPSPSPTPSPTATPSPTPSPTATPTGATATPSPTAAPTATPYNIAPSATITGLGSPTGIAVDSSGDIYVSDQNSSVCTPSCPAIVMYSPGAKGAATPKYFIAGKNTLLTAPTDVKVDKNGYVYVADEASGAGVIYVFAPIATANGNVAPLSTLNSPGAVIGLGLAP
jgi:hypothetical protein